MRKTKKVAPGGTIRDGFLILQLPLEKPHRSKSGKTKLVASTHGFRRIGVRLDGKHEIYVTANAGFYPSEAGGSSGKYTSSNLLASKPRTASLRSMQRSLRAV